MSASDDKFRVSWYVTWKTERPLKQRRRRSPVFFFKNCEWYLEIRFLDDLNSLPAYSYYYLYMVLTKEQQFLPTFTVKTYFLDPQQQQRKPFLCALMKLLDPKGWIARFLVSEVEECIPSFKKEGILKIECLFEEVDSATRSLQSGGHQSVHFPLKAESLLNSSECPSCATGNQNFSLESLSKDLEALLDNKTLPDVQLMVEENSIPCHRVVLTARSSVFAAMFQHKMTESASGVLVIKDMDLSTTEIFLKYLYSGKIPDDLAEEMLVKLFETSDKYEVNALKSVCSRKLMKNLNDENCLFYLSLAEAHSDQEFKDAVVRFIIKDDRLIKSDEWIHFSSENHKLAIEVYRKYVGK